MANPPPPAARPRHSKFLRTLAITFLALIVLTGLVVLIIWLAVKPKRLIYTVEDGSINGYNLANNHLNATFNFVIRAYNPNTKISIYYDRVEGLGALGHFKVFGGGGPRLLFSVPTVGTYTVTVSSHDQTVAFNTIDPFFQPRRNVTHLGTNLVARDLSLSAAGARDLRREKAAGEVELDVRVKAKIRFKVGLWKSAHRTLGILCSPVLVHFSSDKDFRRTFCDVVL